MRYNFKNLIVVSLGGSIMYPDQIDAAYLKKFKKFVEKYLRRGKKFVIVAGGGKISRRYQEAAAKITKVSNEDKDWLGIHATRVNAHLLRTIFREVADPVVLDSRHKMKRLIYPVTIASGWRPGWSTDFIAVALALDFGAGEAVIAGKPSHVFPIRSRGALRAIAASNGTSDKDLDKTKPFTDLTWRKYRKLIPQKWIPGFHSPVDPVAARLAEKKGIAAIVLNGKNLKNFGNLLEGKEFQGTIIQ